MQKVTTTLYQYTIKCVISKLVNVPCKQTKKKQPQSWYLIQDINKHSCTFQKLTITGWFGLYSPRYFVWRFQSLTSMSCRPASSNCRVIQHAVYHQHQIKITRMTYITSTKRAYNNRSCVVLFNTKHPDNQQPGSIHLQKKARIFIISVRKLQVGIVNIIFR